MHETDSHLDRVDAARYRALTRNTDQIAALLEHLDDQLLAMGTALCTDIVDEPFRTLVRAIEKATHREED